MVKIGFLSDCRNRGEMGREENRAYEWLKSSLTSYHIQFVSFEEINQKLLYEVDLLWWHYSVDLSLPEISRRSDIVEGIKSFVRNGGKLLLTLAAAQYVGELGIETVKYDLTESGKWLGSREEDIFGFQGEGEHPVFKGFFGGVYTWRAVEGEKNIRVGYSSESFPSDGKIVGVDKYYIGFDPGIKLLLEYPFGKGCVLTIGAYVYFDCANKRFKKHRDLFIRNCLRYLLNDCGKVGQENYWFLKTPHSVPQELSTIDIYPENFSIDLGEDDLQLYSEAKGVFFYENGQRLLAMGYSDSGIEEIWTYPFRPVRKLRWRVGEDSVSDESKYFSGITVYPCGIKRYFKGDEWEIEQVIIADLFAPTLYLQFRIQSSINIVFYISFESNFRVMWPYGEDYRGKLEARLNETGRGVIIVDRNNAHYLLISLSDSALENRFNTIENDKSVAISSELRYEIEAGTTLMNMVITGGTKEIDKTIATHKTFISGLPGLLSRKKEYYRKVVEKTKVIVPEPDFEKWWSWLKIGLDKCFASVPETGSSYIAGYYTCGEGWFSGRPGYAWFFGRDSVWTGFAALSLGEFEKTKMILKQLQKYQEFTGKIFHELTTSNVVHYDAADATPLYLILMGYYYKYTGDKEFLIESYKHIKKAVEFCFSTDTDNDGFIENTDVGHGWVEGGFLASGNHTTFYLAGLWAVALLESSSIADVVGDKDYSQKLSDAAKKVTLAIEELFWNKERGLYSHHLKKDGSFCNEPTIMPAPVMDFGILNSKKCRKVLQSIASWEFTSDWGTRIIRKISHHYNPEGYHTGSVWPLYTGWVSMAEFLYHRPVQGFLHLMMNFMLIQKEPFGQVPEVLNGDVYRFAGVCPHQAWSVALTILPLMRGLLGVMPDAKNGGVYLAPHFPVHWDKVSVTSIRTGDTVWDFGMERDKETYHFTFNLQEGTPVWIEFSPGLPGNTVCKSVLMNGEEVSWSIEKYGEDTHVSVKFFLYKRTSLSMVCQLPFAIIPNCVSFEENKPSRNIRIIEEEWKGEKYQVTLEGISGRTYDVKVFLGKIDSVKVKNGSLVSIKDGVGKIRVSFPGSGDEYVPHQLELIREG